MIDVLTRQPEDMNDADRLVRQPENIAPNNESLIPDQESIIEKAGKAKNLLISWDHTGNPDRRIAGDPNQALQAIDRLKSMVLAFPDAKTNDEAQNLLADLDNLVAGFRYRQEHGLRGLDGQRELARAELYRLNQDPEAMTRLQQIMETLQNQPDASSFYEQIQSEYHAVLDILEEASDLDDSGFTLDIGQLNARIFGHNEGLSFLNSIGSFVDRYRGLQKIKRNIELVAPLAELQSFVGRDGVRSNPTYDRIVSGVAKVEAPIANGIVGILAGVINNIRAEKSGSAWRYEMADTHEDIANLSDRIEAVIADIQSEIDSSQVDQSALQALIEQDEKLTAQIDAKRKQKDGGVRKFGISVLKTLKAVEADPIGDEIARLENQRAPIRRELHNQESLARVIDEQSDKAQRLIAEAREFLKTL